MSKKIIKLTNIGKQYNIHHQKPTLAENILSFIKPIKKEKIWALKNVNLTIEEGDKLGIIGDNGSGKTTLLKIISGITNPTEGQVKLKGKLVSLIDLRAGFHPELTGIENITLNGMLLGMGKKQIKNKLDSIIEFSGIKNFINVPLYTYSTGMILRLGFSIAINTNPDILIIDEALSVGDISFKKKCIKEIKRITKKNCTLLFASHYLPRILSTCQQSIWLENGKIKNIGKTENIVKLYKQANS